MEAQIQLSVTDVVASLNRLEFPAVLVSSSDSTKVHVCTLQTLLGQIQQCVSRNFGFSLRHGAVRSSVSQMSSDFFEEFGKCKTDRCAKCGVVLFFAPAWKQSGCCRTNEGLRIGRHEFRSSYTEERETVTKESGHVTMSPSHAGHHGGQYDTNYSPFD